MQRAVADRSLDLHARIGALEQLVNTGADGNVLAPIAAEIDREIAQDDTRFVIYLIGAARKIFDRRAIDLFVGLLDRPIDLAFRSQALIGLRELHRHSVARILASRPRSTIVSAVATQHLGVIDENFTSHGTDLTSADRRRIESALRTVADNEAEIDVLRDEAQQCLGVCRALDAAIEGGDR
jgi:hypothetical protein